MIVTCFADDGVVAYLVLFPPLLCGAAPNSPVACFQVTEYVGFCTTPSDRRQARREAKTMTKGRCEVPKVNVDGYEDLLVECKLEIQEFSIAVEAGTAAGAARTAAKAAERVAVPAPAAAAAVGATAPGMETVAVVEGAGVGAPTAGAGAAGGALGEGGRTTTPAPAPLSLVELAEYLTLLGNIRATERVQRDQQRLADKLVSRCQVGHAEQGGRRIQRPIMVATCNSKAATSARVCWGDRCRTREKNPVLWW